ncbi:MAG: hypothetical protein JW741_24850 [Sedimentisphaerales bacterium]|nr:hypothetical protein [Sedimentisphaerales bacterium]
MTIEFNCPHCGALIAFDSKHAGKQATCLTCRKKFIIPAQNFEKPKKIEPEKQRPADPLPGYYRAVFVDSWKVFVNPQNTTTTVFVAAVVCFKFFLATACCLNYISTFIIWGWLFGFYLSVIDRTAMEDDTLPEIYLGTSITFLWYVIRPFLIFFYTLFLVEFPFIIALSLSPENTELVRDLASNFGALPLHLQILLLWGLFVFPAAILTTAVGKDLALLRPDYVVAPILKAFIPYILTVLLLVAACLLQAHTTQHTFAGPVTTAADLALNLAVQVVAIIAMRSIGLFYRHYTCHFKW